MLHACNEKNENYSGCSQVKFILDNASLVNICNDLSTFIRMTSASRIRWYRSGSAIERATGQIAIAVKDSNSGQFSRIELESIYDPSADVNLLSQDKLMKDFGMTMSITPNNLKCWMKNSQISIQFDKMNGFYATNALSMGTMGEHDKMDDTLTLMTPVVEEHRDSMQHEIVSTVEKEDFFQSM